MVKIILLPILIILLILGGTIFFKPEPAIAPEAPTVKEETTTTKSAVPQTPSQTPSLSFERTPSLPPSSKNVFQKIEEETIEKVLTPTPLKIDRPAISPDTSFLSAAGIIVFTNLERNASSLPSLIENQKLNMAATEKANDILEKQYFAHTSPSGTTAGDLAKSNDYEFILIGENLALGNFRDDKEMVLGWMNSPGHRANILNNKFKEIGVGVKRGFYEGKMVWVGVQIFAIPRSACLEPDLALLQKIDENKNRLDGWQITLETWRSDIEQTEPKHGEVYNKKIDDYNALVKDYNNLVGPTQNLIDEYNAQIKATNICMEMFVN